LPVATHCNLNTRRKTSSSDLVFPGPVTSRLRLRRVQPFGPKRIASFATKLPIFLCLARYTHVMKDQVRGKAEEIKGKVTGDRGEEMKGKARQALGNVKRDVRDLKADATSKSAGRSKLG